MVTSAGSPQAPALLLDGEIRVVARRHPWQWAAAAVVLLGLAQLARLSVSNPNFQWEVFAGYLFSPIILKGLLLTLWLTSATMVLGIALGIVLALMRISSSLSLSWVAAGFIWFFRGTPVLVQLIIWYNLAALFPTYEIALPFGPPLLSGSVNDLISPYTAALLGLGLNEAAYMAEIIRAGIGAVHEGQQDAAKALGMRHLQTMRRVVLPQAARFIIPPTGNQTINMLKTTSIVCVIALSDLTYSAQSIYSQTYQTIPLLLVASFWYLVATSLLSLLQERIERRFDRRQGIRA